MSDSPQVLASDVALTWGRRIRAAQHSIVVFTPYFDALLKRLLSRANVPAGHVVVVTDLTPGAGALDYPAQLRAALQLIDAGFEVRSIQRLHAKVLVTDWELATVGSQNFTRFAQQSRETTVVLQQSLADSGFLTTLREWYEESWVVPRELVMRLLRDIEADARNLIEAGAALVASFEATSASFETEQAQLEQARILELVQKSRYELANGRVWATVRNARADAWPPYHSLIADRGYDFTSWTVKLDGQPRQTDLKRLEMIPILDSAAGRMAFVRLARGRITYVRTAVNWTAPFLVAGRSMKVRIDCPRSGTRRRNLVCEASDVAAPAVRLNLDLKFEGDVLRLVGHRSVGHSWRNASYSGLRDLWVDYLQSSAGIEEFVSAVFHSFKYQTLGIGTKNVREFFAGSRYEIRLFEFAGTPILTSRMIY